jgi:hypothetical protein
LQKREVFYSKELNSISMARFLSCSELYETIQQKSSEAKEILWVCSPYLGQNAHEVFSQEILRNPLSDIRFVFRLNYISVKSGEVNPYEVQYFMEHFKGSSVKSHDNFHSKIYIFDNSALITSANLTKTAFESNIEVGVLLDGPQVDEVKRFFDQSLWQTAKPIGDLRKFKRIWNAVQKSAKNVSLKKGQFHTKIKDWTDDYVDTWYIGVPFRLSAKTERKIKKETNWRTELSVVGDIGYQTFKQIKLGDLAYLADLSKKRGKIEIKLARIFDKSRVETDEGDLHFACETENNYSLEREKFYEMLKEAGIGSRTCETILSDDQLKHVTSVLSSIKHKRKKSSKP